MAHTVKVTYSDGTPTESSLGAVAAPNNTLVRCASFCSCEMRFVTEMW
jgi:hypothetical protein